MTMWMGEKIKQLREQKGLTQYELAEKIGCGKHNISTWELGKYEPLLANVVALADFFNVSIDELCCRDFKEAKQGKWVWKDYRFRCSVCDEAIPKVTTDNKQFINETYKYCRWCGARMDYE